jgi:uncharacterized protein (TIGR00255 family)
MAQIRSMTGFARKQNKGDWGTIAVELRTVNHRYLDISLRLPEALRSLDNEVRELIRNALGRGKVEVFVRFEVGETTTAIELNQAVAKQLIQACETLRELTPGASQINVTDLMQWPGVLQCEEPDEALLKPAFLSTVDEALASLQAMRGREGAQLTELIGSRLTGIQQQIDILRPHQDSMMGAQREKLRIRLEEAKINVDPNRLEQELILWAQRADVAEELDRLGAHIVEVQRTLKQGGAVGRRLDFLMQELNREANTLSSKSVSVITTNAAVEIKVLIEQMREQVQNLE